MTTKAAKCDQPAEAMVKLADLEIPACSKHIDEARNRSAKAGKTPVPKGMNKTQTAAFLGANRDDKLPINVRAFTEIEREQDFKCLAHHLGEPDK